jgi:hypothetical protein
VSAAVQDQEQEPAPVQEAAPEPTFQELREEISTALSDYKKRQAAVAGIREDLSKARKQEAQLLQKSLTDDSQKVIDGIARARVEIEVASRRATVAEQSLAGLEGITGPMIRLRNKIVQQLRDLSAQRTRAHYDALLAAQLDPEAFDRFCIHHGLGRGENALWALAALGSDVIVLQSLFPYLTWVGNPGLELSLAKVESDIERLFTSLERFEAGVGSDK